MVANVDCFNPSLGLTILRTQGQMTLVRPVALFQSLTRVDHPSDRECSDGRRQWTLFQSLTRVDHPSDKPSRTPGMKITAVSIPHSG